MLAGESGCITFSSLLGIIVPARRLASSTVTAVHAFEHGEEPHDHEGVPCVIQLIDTGDYRVDPPAAPVAHAIQARKDHGDQLGRSEITTDLTSAWPPPTGPPLS